MVSDGVLIAFVGAAATFSPVLMSVLTNRHRTRERAVDHARQDAVAAKAVEAAQLLLESNARVAEAAAEAAKVAKVSGAKLNVIKKLVNSNMTAVLMQEYDATANMLVIMVENAEIKRLNGHEPSLEALRRIDEIKAKLASLSSNLEERKAMAASPAFQAEELAAELGTTLVKAKGLADELGDVEKAVQADEEIVDVVVAAEPDQA